MRKLDYVRQLISGERQFPPAGQMLGMKMISADEGTTVIEMPVDERFMNNAGGVQGGILAALADSAMGTSVGTVERVDESHVTVEFKLNFLRPATPDSSPLRATANVLNKGKRFAHTEAEIRGVTGELIAKATASWLLRDL